MKLTFLIPLLCYSLVSLGQEEHNLEVFNTDSTWIKEIIEFPIGFAQDIKYEGFEDLRFPRGWSKAESPNFWSYVWAWNITAVGQISTNDLEKNIQLYFDGLLGLNYYNIDGKAVRKTNAVFIKEDKNLYVGKVNTFDTRYTKKPMSLRVKVNIYHCEQEKKTIIHFRFSPKPFDDAVWELLGLVELKNGVCLN